MINSRASTIRLWQLAASVAFLGAVLVMLAQVSGVAYTHPPPFYAAMHALVELFSVVIALLVFAAGWFQANRRLKTLILTSAFLAVGLLDIGHLLSDPAMPDFLTPNSSSKAAAFGLAARLVSAAALLAYAACLTYSPSRAGSRRWGLVMSATLTGAVYWLVLYRPGLMAAVLDPAPSAASFTLWLRYTVTTMYALAAALLFRAAMRGGQLKHAYLLAAALMLAMMEIAVAQRVHPSDLFDLASHTYKAVAYGFLYWAIYVEAIKEPYQQLKLSEMSLALSENKFRSFVEFAPDAVLLMDHNGKITGLNKMAQTLFGVSDRDAKGTDGLNLVPLWEAGHDGTPEVMCQRATGGWFPAEVNRGEIQSDGGVQTMVVVRDISERKRVHQTFVDQLTHDALTGLPNRTLIIGKLQDAMSNARMGAGQVAVHVLDVDFFKKINDTFGHNQGDEVLRECVQRLTAILPAGDTLARHGGDEFIIVQNNVAGVEQAAALADELLTAMRRPFRIHDHDVFLSASIGLVLFPDDDITEDGLLQKANVAMSSAKKDGRDSYRFYTPDMDERLRARLKLEGYLHNAVENEELLLHYQPKVCFATQRIVGVEALVRWNHPKLGLVQPGQFIPVAEESGLIAEIGLWVLQEACTQIGKWQAQGLPPLRVSVNLSARQFQQLDLPIRIQQVLNDTGLDPKYLELELTESTVMRDTEAAIAALKSLKELGVWLSIDDFGTGYSSLSYLKQFPIDVLKIDRSFVKDVITDPDDAAIARAIVALAHGMDLAVLAEGVETLQQAQFLHANGCNDMQGFYFSRPLLPEDFSALFLAQDGSTLAGTAVL